MQSNVYTKNSSNKLKMKALVGWDILYQYSKLFNFNSFLNQDKDWYGKIGKKNQKKRKREKDWEKQDKDSENEGVTEKA